MKPYDKLKVVEEDEDHYLVECGICHLDKELFSTPIKIKRKSFNSGFVPCGCRKNYFWSWEQYLVKINRRLADTGFVFKGLASELKGKCTKLNMYCTLCNVEWCPNIHNLLRGSGCPSCGNKKKGLASIIDPEVIISKILASRSYPDGVKIKKVSIGKYSVYCPICAVDEYSVNGLCNGTFISGSTSLQNGRLTCRCNPNHPLKPSQVLYKLGKVLNNLGGRLINGYGGGIYTKDYAEWCCEKGHTTKTLVKDLFRGVGCKFCAAEKNINDFGYYKNRADELDFLYIIKLSKEDEHFIKIGRSFIPEDRISGISTESGYSCEVLYMFRGKHKDVFPSEQKLHKHLNPQKYFPKTPFAGSIRECFEMSSFDRIPSIINNLQENLSMVN